MPLCVVTLFRLPSIATDEWSRAEPDVKGEIKLWMETAGTECIVTVSPHSMTYLEGTGASASTPVF